MLRSKCLSILLLLGVITVLFAPTITQASANAYLDTVQKIYIGYYQRPADPSGLIYWADRIDRSGGNISEAIEAFANSAESQALYGNINSSNISTIVNDIYFTLFGRNAETGGLNYYVNGFNSGQFTPATIMLNVLSGAQNEDFQSVNNKLTAANLFTRTIDPELDGSNFPKAYRTFLANVTWNPVTVPTPAGTTAYIQTNIADLSDAILAAKAILNNFSNQFSTTRPTYDQLYALMQPVTSDNFMGAGRNREEYLLMMATDAPIGIQFENIALYREMKTHNFGDVAPWTINELPNGYAEGVWCSYIYRAGNSVSYAISAFVRENPDGPWIWHGDQNPFRFGGVIQPESAYWRASSSYLRLRIYSGLRLRAEDQDNAALNNYGIVAFDTFNSALPQYISPTSGNTDNVLSSIKDSVSSASVKYSLNPPLTWRSKYWEKDGLDINAITNSEFVFVGYNGSNQPVHVWISLLDKKPIKEADLWKDSWSNVAAESTGNYFSKLLSIWAEPAGVYVYSGDLNSSSIPLQWEIASLVDYVSSAEVYWSDTPNTTFVGPDYIENPALFDGSLNITDWKSTTFAISGLGLPWPPVSGMSGIMCKDESLRRYYTEIDYRVVNSNSSDWPPIDINDFFISYQTYSDASKNGFVGYFAFVTNGLWIEDGDIQEIKLLNLTASTEIPLESISFKRNIYYNNLSADSPNSIWEPYYYSGYNPTFPTGTDIQPGQYRYTAVTKYGDTLQANITVTNHIELNVVDASSMHSEWVNGDLKLSWQSPSGPQGTYIKVWIKGGNTDNLILGFTVPLSTQEFTIPKRVIESTKILNEYRSATWIVQLRLNGNNNLQVARGTSEKVVLDGWQ